MSDTHEDSFPQETNTKILNELKLQRKEISNILKRNKLFRNPVVLILIMDIIAVIMIIIEIV